MLVARLLAATAVIFHSEDTLRKSLEPLALEEVTSRIKSLVQFGYDSNFSEKRVVPLRGTSVGNLLKTKLYEGKTVTVFYPEHPRVPYHLTIALNRAGVKGAPDVTEEENQELFATIKKIAEIYRTVSLQGFAIAQYDTSQEGHLGHYVVEIIPHLPGFEDIKNIVYMVERNRYVLFRTANLSPVQYRISDEDILKQVQTLQEAFLREHGPLENKAIAFPYTRKECFQPEAEEILQRHLLEILQDKGGKIEEATPLEALMPEGVPEVANSVTSHKCFFCDQNVIQRQLVYENDKALVFYNMRKGARPGDSFLILPKRHTEKTYGLELEEVRDIGILRRALVEVLREAHPGSEVKIYAQDDPSVGQTVFHTHEQVVAVDPKTIALTWTMMSLSPENVSQDEMLKVREEYGSAIRLKLEQALKEIAS